MSNVGEYIDETEVFYKNPLSFVQKYFTPEQSNDQLLLSRIPVEGQEWSIDPYIYPTHLMVFDNTQMLPLIEFLQMRGYNECARFENGYFADDPRKIGDVLILCRRSKSG